MRVCPICRSQFPPGSNFCPHDGHRLEEVDAAAPSHDPLLGKVLDTRYKIEKKLGSGGMGEVYAARHVIIDKPVAIKVLRLEYSKDPRQAERFIREARAASHIGHPNIVDVTDFGRLDNGQIYFVMEFLVGLTLAREVRVRGAQPIRRVLYLAIQICRALQAAHAKGIVHRDLKPENIFIVNPATEAAGEAQDSDGRQQDTIKLLDFGIAKISWDEQTRRLTKVGSIFGTPQYMSPEQAAGKETDHRGDIYALGCIIYEMLTGELPFTADTFMGTLTKHLFEQPVPPRQLRPDLGIPTELERVVLKALEKDPDERHQSMLELAEALEECLDIGAPSLAGDGDPGVMGGEQVDPLERSGLGPTLPPLDERETLIEEPAETIVPRRRTSNPWLWAALGLFLLLSGGGVYLVLRQQRQHRSPSKTPQRWLDQGLAAATEDDAGPPAQDAALVGGALDGAIAVEGDMPTSGGRIVTLQLISDPPGAMVEQGGRVLGPAPLTVRLPRGATRTFLFRLGGHETVQLRANTKADPQRRSYRVRLRRLSGVSPRLEDLRNPFKKKRR